MNASIVRLGNLGGFYSCAAIAASCRCSGKSPKSVRVADPEVIQLAIESVDIDLGQFSVFIHFPA